MILILKHTVINFEKNLCCHIFFSFSFYLFLLLFSVSPVSTQSRVSIVASHYCFFLLPGTFSNATFKKKKGIKLISYCKDRVSAIFGYSNDYACHVTRVTCFHRAQTMASQILSLPKTMHTWPKNGSVSSKIPVISVALMLLVSWHKFFAVVVKILVTLVAVLCLYAALLIVVFCLCSV